MTDLTVFAPQQDAVIYDSDDAIYVYVGPDVGPAGPPGPAGPASSVPGPAGKSVLNGTVPPTGAVGVDGDFYIDTTADAIYGPKTAGAWGPPTSLVGPPGATGATGAASTVPGPAGPTGPRGYSVLNGAGAPAGGAGIDGDFFIDTNADAIYGPKTAGAWGSPTSLIGPQGPQGIQGVQGPQGLPGAGATSDLAYGPSWDGVTNVSPSQNAVYDKIQTLGAPTTIVGITGTLAQFDVALTDHNFAVVGRDNNFAASQSINAANGQLTINPSSGSSVVELMGAAGTQALRLQATTGVGNIRADTVNITNKANSATYAVFSATGLAVTGTIAATGAITSGGSALATVSQLANYMPTSGGTFSGQVNHDFNINYFGKASGTAQDSLTVFRNCKTYSTFWFNSYDTAGANEIQDALLTTVRGYGFILDAKPYLDLKINGAAVAHMSATTMDFTTPTMTVTGAIYAGGNKRVYQQASAMAGGEIYMSTSAPSGGADGDIWLQYV